MFEAHLEAADPKTPNNEFNGQLGVLDPRKAGLQNQTKAIPFVSGYILFISMKNNLAFSNFKV